MATNSAKVYQELKIEPIRPNGGAHDAARGRIALESFLPYQLSVIASRVSRGFRPGLRHGWRCRPARTL